MFKFKIDIFNEISWQKFTQLPGIKLLTLNEQVKKYNLYINELTHERNAYLHWLEGHKKGHQPVAESTSSEPSSDLFLLLEGGDFLLQEDSDKIIL